MGRPGPGKAGSVRTEATRSKNLRQLLLRTTRTMNALLAEELDRRGYKKIRPAHSAFFANVDLEGNTVTVVAERANMTKQAMGQLVSELEELGYVTRRPDEHDKRAQIVVPTKSGHKLMYDSMQIIDDIEQHYANILGEQTMNGLRTGLAAFMGVRQLT